MYLIVVVFLFIFLLLLSGTNCQHGLMAATHSNTFRMIPTDEAETVYGPSRENDEIVFRPITFSADTTAPQRMDRRTSTPVDRRSSPPSAYIRSI